MKLIYVYTEHASRRVGKVGRAGRNLGGTGGCPVPRSLTAADSQVELENKLKLALVPVCIGVGMATGAGARI